MADTALEELEAVWAGALERFPDAVSGEWRIVHSSVSEDEGSRHERMARFLGATRWTGAGEYVALMRGKECWMANEHDEMADHLEMYEQVHRRGGRVLIHGLGLGLILRAVLDLPQVEHVDVVELEPDVIRLVRPAFGYDEEAGRLAVWEGDCFEMQWTPGRYWEVVWHDIWQPLLERNLAEMDLLFRRFEDRCDWQGAWGREWLMERRRKVIRPWRLSPAAERA